MKIFLFAARDKDGGIWLYGKLPRRNIDEGIWICASEGAIPVDSKFHPEITWESEPHKIYLT